MARFSCAVCGGEVYLENSRCTGCGSELGFWRERHEIVVVNPEGVFVDPEGWIWHRCRNLELSGCTWLSPVAARQCFSCDLTRTRPNDRDLRGLGNFEVAERAKRRLIVELDELKLAIVTRDADPEHGLAFDLLSSAAENVVTGHDSGVITIDLSESEPVHREQMREQLDEPYRTMLGNFRHEVGHYYESVLVTDKTLALTREVFGDDSIDYSAALEQHYQRGPQPTWSDHYISAYASAHPFEDFAETFAHFMHITATVNTARSFGLTTADPTAFAQFRDLVTGVWVPLSIAFNQINLAMGKDALYPFVIAPAVLEKLDFVANLVRSRAEEEQL